MLVSQSIQLVLTCPVLVSQSIQLVLTCPVLVSRSIQLVLTCPLKLYVRFPNDVQQSVLSIDLSTDSRSFSRSSRILLVQTGVPLPVT